MYEALALKHNAHRFAGSIREEIIINKINFSKCFGIRDGKALASRYTPPISNLARTTRGCLGHGNGNLTDDLGSRAFVTCRSGQPCAVYLVRSINHLAA